MDTIDATTDRTIIQRDGLAGEVARINRFGVGETWDWAVTDDSKHWLAVGSEPTRRAAEGACLRAMDEERNKPDA